MSLRPVLVLAALLPAALGRTLGDCTGGDPNSSAPVDGFDSLDFGDCDWSEYAKKRLGGPAVPAALGVLLLLVFPAFVIFRACCQCCKCNGAESATGGRVRMVKILTLLCVIVAAGGAAMLFAGSTKGHDAYVDLFNGVQAVPTYVTDSINGVDTCMAGIPQYDPSTLDSARKQAADFHDSVQDAKKKADKIEGTRQWATLVFGGVALALVLALAVAAMCCSEKCACPALSSSVYLFLASVMLMCCGAAFVVETMTKDTCPELDKQLQGEQNLLTALPSQACDEAGLDTAQQDLEKVKEDTAEEACKEIYGDASNPARCDANLGSIDPPFYCEPVDCSNPPSVEELTNRLNSSQYAHLKPLAPGGCGNVPDSECTVRICSEQCGNTDIKDIATLAWDNMTAANTAVNCIDTWFNERKLNDCTALFNTIGVEPQVSTCSTMKDAFALLSGATALFGIALIAAGILCGCPFIEVEYYSVPLQQGPRAYDYGGTAPGGRKDVLA
eukprot:TRINITY_DN35587_c0_g1_i1.p1 TRINITY_DN35587_c0_g1~~TRINITY_DN35587_c0_g1_i1.p1  ORF type:complete len:501 (+),score=204.69 TRINITY_DN35587_c0_g1_i1:55-1557(+)